MGVVRCQHVDDDTQCRMDATRRVHVASDQKYGDRRMYGLSGRLTVAHEASPIPSTFPQ